MSAIAASGASVSSGLRLEAIRSAGQVAPQFTGFQHVPVLILPIYIAGFELYRQF